MTVIYTALVYWPHRETPVRWEGTADALKSYLDKEVFCLRHNCPLPNGVEIFRSPR